MGCWLRVRVGIGLDVVFGVLVEFENLLKRKVIMFVGIGIFLDKRLDLKWGLGVSNFG